MTKFFKMLCVFIAICMMALAFAACGGKTNDSGNTGNTSNTGNTGNTGNTDSDSKATEEPSATE